MSSYRLNTDVSVSQTRRQLVQAFDNWRGAELVSIPDQRDMPDERAVVVFDFNGNRCRVEYDKQPNYRSNLRAIYLTIEGLRMAYRRGLGDILINTVSQMLALPGAAYIDPYELLGVRSDAPLEVAEAAWKAMLKQHHPDRAVDDDDRAKRTVMTQQLNEAIERIREDKAKGGEG